MRDSASFPFFLCVSLLGACRLPRACRETRDLVLSWFDWYQQDPGHSPDTASEMTFFVEWARAFLDRFSPGGRQAEERAAESAAPDVLSGSKRPSPNSWLGNEAPAAHLALSDGRKARHNGSPRAGERVGETELRRALGEQCCKWRTLLRT